MSRKRRTFDIVVPEDEAPIQQPRISDPTVRRGPMATAMRETGASLSERRDAEAEIRAENDRLAHEFVALQRDGLIVGRLPLDAIHTRRLTRDRAAGPDAELDELVASIRDIGLSNPIRVVAADGGDGYELIQGFRRLSAYRLLAETDDRFSTIPAGIVEAQEGTEALYRRMVDENLIRKDISFAEMAQLARDYGADPTVGAPGVEAAIAALYGSVGKQKRSYIRAFVDLLDRLDTSVIYPAAIPRALGLDLRKRMADMPDVAEALLAALRARPDRTEGEELDILRRFAGAGQSSGSPRGTVAEASDTPARPRGKTTVKLERPEGIARVTASDGKVELKLDRDFSACDPHRLSAAVEAFLRELGH